MPKDTSNIYSKVSIIINDKKYSKKHNGYILKNSEIIDFSKDHLFKLNNESIESVKVEIEIKHSSSIWTKSIQAFLFTL